MKLKNTLFRISVFWGQKFTRTEYDAEFGKICNYSQTFEEEVVSCYGHLT